MGQPGQGPVPEVRGQVWGASPERLKVSEGGQSTEADRGRGRALGRGCGGGHREDEKTAGTRR